MDFSFESLKWLWNLENYWYALVSAYIGALLGIRWTKRKFRKDEESRRSNSLMRLAEAIESNLKLIDIARSVLTGSPAAIPNFPFDSSRLSNWIAASHDFLDPETVRKLDWQRLQLEHIGQKFMIMNSGVISTIGNSQLTAAQTGYLGAVISSLLTHLQQTEDELRDLKAVPELCSIK